MPDAAVALNDEGQVETVPKHVVSSVKRLTLCGRSGAPLIGMRWDWVRDEDRCPECVLFLSAEQ